MDWSTLKLLSACVAPLLFVVLMAITVCIIMRTFHIGISASAMDGASEGHWIPEMGKPGFWRKMHVTIKIDHILVIQPNDPPELGKKEQCVLPVETCTAV